jgi:hypothetical protein
MDLLRNKNKSVFASWAQIFYKRPSALKNFELEDGFKHWAGV